MGVLKTLLCTLVLLFPCTLVAMPRDADERAQVFATCLGRYSAMMEHAWLMSGDDPGARASRALFEDLLDATLPETRLRGVDVLDRRIRAKMALAQALQIAQFHRDAQRQRRARAEVLRSLRPCQALLLG